MSAGAWLAGVLADPAALLGLLLLLCCAMWRAGRTRALGLVLLAATAGLFAFASPLTANALMARVEGTDARQPDCMHAPADAPIVVLAGGLQRPAADDGDVGSLSAASLRRVLAAVRLAAAWPQAPLVLAGGHGGDVREADLMATLARQAGVAPARLTLDRRSTTTWDSAVALQALRAGSAAPRHIRLVTSASHLQRAAEAFERAGFGVCPLRGVDPQTLDVGLEEAWPRLSAALKSADALHELVGRAAYAWRAAP